MAKSGTGGWSKRYKVGNTTTTVNTNKGITISQTSGDKNARITYTKLPGGGTKTTTTYNSSLGRRVITSTNTGRSKKQKRVNLTKTKLSLYEWIFVILIGIFLLSVMDTK